MRDPSLRPAELRQLKVRNTFIDVQGSSSDDLEIKTSSWGRAMTDPVDTNSIRRSSEEQSPIMKEVSNLPTASEQGTASSSFEQEQPSAKGSLEEADSDSDISNVGQGPMANFGRQGTDEDRLYRTGMPQNQETSSTPVMGPPGNWYPPYAMSTMLVPPPAYLDPGWNLQQTQEAVPQLWPLSVPLSTAQIVGNSGYPPEAPAVVMPQQLLDSLMSFQKCQSAKSDASLSESLAEKTTLNAIRDLSFSVTLADPCLPDCPLIGCSEGFEVLTGYQRAEIIGRNCRFLNRHVNLSDPVRRKLRDAVQNGTEFIGILQNVRKDGVWFRNLLHLTTMTVRGKLYTIGVQADAAQLPVDNLGAGHTDAVRRAAEKIFSGHLNAWIQMEAREFSIRLPASDSQPLKVVSPECYDQALERYVQIGKGRSGKKPPSNRKQGPNSVSNPNIDCVSTVLMSDMSSDEAESSIWSYSTVPKSQKQRPGPVGSAAAQLDGGHLKSLGSAQHPHGCVECSFFFFGPSGCRSGANCSFCHEFHERSNGKKNRKLLRRLVKPGKVPTGPEERMRLVSSTAPPDDLSAKGDDDSSSQSMQSGGADTAAGHAAAVRDAAPVLQQALPPTPKQGTSDIVSIGYGKTDGRAEMQQVMLVVGVQVALHLRMDFHSPEKAALQKHITFSVEPKLPRGMHFDTTTGLIGGTPQEKMARTIYVVTAGTPATGPGGMSLGTLPLTSTSFSLGVSDLQDYTIFFSSEDQSDSGSNRLTIQLQA